MKFLFFFEKLLFCVKLQLCWNLFVKVVSAYNHYVLSLVLFNTPNLSVSTLPFFFAAWKAHLCHKLSPKLINYVTMIKDLRRNIFLVYIHFIVCFLLYYYFEDHDYTKTIWVVCDLYLLMRFLAVAALEGQQVQLVYKEV